MKKGQELPGWTYVIGIILALVALVFLIWLAMKSGQASVEQIAIIP